MSCPICHAEMRLGVRLPKLKARIVDLVTSAGDLGITSAEIMAEIYPNGGNLTTVRVHIGQINDILAETDWKLVTDGRGKYARWYLYYRGMRLAIWNSRQAARRATCRS